MKAGSYWIEWSRNLAGTSGGRLQRYAFARKRMWNTRETVDGKPHRAMMLPSMYGLGAKVRVGVFEKTTLKGVMEMKSLTRLVRKVYFTSKRG